MTDLDTAPKDYVLPAFTPPGTTMEARERMAELDLAIASIDNQYEYRKLADTLDADWYKRAMTSRRFKALERQRLEDWVDEYTDAADHGLRLETFIVEVVRDEFEAAEWEGIVSEAQAAMKIAKRGK